MNATPRAISISAAVALLLAAVWLFWPLALGGGTLYVSTHGISMQPRFHTGDLAILRAADHYSVGDVVAYRSVTLKTTVMHRIVAKDGNRFVIQGDNNSWLDPDEPTPNLVLGKLWLRIPQGGKALGVLHSPAALGLIAVAGMGVLGVLDKPRRRARGRRKPRDRKVFPTSTRAMARQTVLASAGVALVAATGGGVLLSMPPTQTDASSVTVTQQGRYDYTGTAVVGTTYPTGRIMTGDPIYTKLTGDLTVSLKETLGGADLSALTGTLRLAVSIAAPDGWTADVGRGAAVPLVHGRTARASAVVQTAAASELLARHYAEVGSSGNEATLTVTPQLVVRGTVAGQPFPAKPLPGLAFSLTATNLRLAGTPSTALNPSAGTPVTVELASPRHFSVFGHPVPLSVARLATLVVLALALVVLAVAWWIGRSPSSEDPADAFLMRNAARILPVTRFTPGNTVIDVSDGDALHRVAERLDTLVLHQEGPDDHVFAVHDIETTYRFVLPVTHGGRAGLRPEVPQLHERATTRLQPVVDDDTARISRVRRRIPVPPPRTPEPA
jgi:signal peptidase I